MSHTGADLIAEGLAALGVRQSFGIVSIHNMPLFDAIRRRGVTRITDASHEQAAAHAADGYARATGDMGVVIGSTGPGTTNALTGLYEAEFACSPLLLITGQSETSFLGRGLGYVHELDQQAELLRRLTPNVASPRSIDEIGSEFARVTQAMRLPRTSPGAIEVPIDLQYAEAREYDFGRLSTEPPQVDESALDAVFEALLNSRKRLIIAGGGAVQSGAREEIEALADLLGAPVLTSASGRGAMDEHHPLSMGALWNSRSMHKAVKDAEVTLALGTRFKVGVDGADGRLVPPGALLQVDLDASVFGRVHEPSQTLVGDVKQVLGALLERLRCASNELSAGDKPWVNAVAGVRDGLRGAIWNRLGPDIGAAMKSLLAVLPSDFLLVRDTTIIGFTFVNQLTSVRAPRRFIYPTTAAIGPGLPLAIGACSGSELPTLLVSGDGGFLYHATELATAARENLPLKSVVMNDGGYGVLRGLQASAFEGRWGNTDLGDIDFAALAQSLGVPAARASTVEDFEAAITQAFASPGPYLVDFGITNLLPMAGHMMPRDPATGA